MTVAVEASHRAGVLAELEALTPELVTASEYIHDHPEIGYEEHQASDLLSRALERDGFVLERAIDGIPTAFRATSEGRPGSATIAFIAEMDALPDIGHACGHNLSGPAAVGAAIALRRVVGDLGTIQVLGTPAEEIPPPLKKRLVEDGYFAGVDVVLMVHAADRTAVGGETLAIEALDIDFHGRASHASATPDLGISALDAAVLTMHAIEMLREHVRPTTRLHGIITNGGQAPNVVPDRASLRYYVRTPDNAYLQEVVERVRRCAEGAAIAIGASVTITPRGTWESRRNVALLNDVLLRHAVESGAFNVAEASERAGSTDFGSVTQILPAATLKLPLVDEGTPGHSQAYVDASKGERAERCLSIGAAALALTGLQLFEEPQLLEAIQRDFQRSGEDAPSRGSPTNLPASVTNAAASATVMDGGESRKAKVWMEANSPVPGGSAAGVSPDYRQFSAKRDITGRPVLVSYRRISGRGLRLEKLYSRALCKYDIHELISTGETAGPGDDVQDVAYIGFFEVERGGDLRIGDVLRVGEREIGRVLGFDMTHFPNHMNIVVGTAEQVTGRDLGLTLNDELCFSAE